MYVGGHSPIDAIFAHQTLDENTAEENYIVLL
jgi:hypothetical protein